MRVLASLFVSVFAAQAAFSCCLFNTPKAKEFFAGTSYFARATALSQDRFLITEVFRGKMTAGTIANFRGDSAGESITVSSGADCLPQRVKGREYLVAGGGGVSVPRYIAWPPPAELADFLDGLHVVTAADLFDRLTAWRNGQLPSGVFLDWLNNADTETRVYRDFSSLLVTALSDTEFLVEASDASELCNFPLSQSLKSAVAESLAGIIRVVPEADAGPPAERDVGDPKIDRYNPVRWRLEDWKQEIDHGPQYDAIRECWNRKVSAGGRHAPHRLLPQQ